MLRTLDAKIINDLANHPEVRPFLGGSGFLDLTSFVENIKNFCLMSDTKDGAYLLINKDNGIYEVHTLSYPGARGKIMFKLMHQARAFMFIITDCVELNTYVPDGLSNVNSWTINAGFHEDFKRENCFDLNGKNVGLTYYSMSYENWVLKDIENLKEGQNFHALIEASHKEDSIHDYWVGATIRSIKALNYVKGISFYNKWSIRTGYEPILPLAYQPMTVDIGTHILQLNADGIEVLRVK